MITSVSYFACYMLHHNLFWQLDKKNSDSDNHKKAEYLMWSSSRWVISRPTAYSMTTHSDICVIYFYLYLCHLCLKRVCRNDGNNGTRWKTIRDKKVMKLYLTLLFNVIIWRKHTFLPSLLSFSLILSASSSSFVLLAYAQN